MLCAPSFGHLLRLDEQGYIVAMENRLQNLYWTELVQLKVDCEYFRYYRDSLSTRVTGFALIRAVVSVSALGAWAAVRGVNPAVWGTIIVAAQVADALQNTLAFATRFRATSALVVTLDALFIDCQMEWEDIFSGRIDVRKSPSGAMR